MNIFRKGALLHHSDRLEGDILLTREGFSSKLVILVAAIAIFIVGWAIMGQYSRTETVQGEVLPTGLLSKIYATRPGMVSRLFVREGEVVKAGQPLAAISVEEALAKGSSPNDQRLASIQQQDMLLAREKSQEDRRSSQDRARLSLLIAEIEGERATLTDQIALQKRAVASAQETFDSLQTIVEKGFATKTDLETRRQALLSANQGLADIVGRLGELDERLSTTRAQLAELPVDRADKLVELQISAENLNEHRVDTETNQAYLIKAPISGRVTSIQSMTGRFVDARVPMLSIVPITSTMEATLFAPSRAVGLAREGQPVRLMYDAFPFERFGSFGGQIQAISRTILSPTEVDAPFKLEEPVYRIRVRLSDQAITAFGERVALQPGMTLKANIVLDKRSFLEWLLEPIEAVRARS
ncbi:MAG: HlyD family efflux transporter periplasmic adaptor subunit [Sphingomonas bacterium]